MLQRLQRRTTAFISVAVLGWAAGCGHTAVGQTPAEDRPADAGRDGVATGDCSAETADPWVGDLRTRVLTHNELARYAVEHHGDPLRCHGEVTSVFDGMKFGRLILDFAKGVELRVETFPPESSQVALIMPHGFSDEDQARVLLRDYVAGIGVGIDWSKPVTSVERSETVQKFESPVAGHNAAATLVFTDGSLTEIRFGMAL